MILDGGLTNHIRHSRVGLRRSTKTEILEVLAVIYLN